MRECSLADARFGVREQSPAHGLWGVATVLRDPLSHAGVWVLRETGQEFSWQVLVHRQERPHQGLGIVGQASQQSGRLVGGAGGGRAPNCRLRMLRQAGLGGGRHPAVGGERPRGAERDDLLDLFFGQIPTLQCRPAASHWMLEKAPHHGGGEALLNC
ncbi:hypothetical protein GCM10017562_75340 [Streptomyces roseofulvus]